MFTSPHWHWKKTIVALLLLIASAYVSVTLPISEKGIPFTAQSLVVFYLAGMLLPSRTFVVIAGYLILGIIGLPVFADGGSGWSKIVGASGGFLYGFLFSGMFIAMALWKERLHSLGHIMIIMILGTVVLFVFGIGHLSYKFGFEKALEYGFHPFWKMALVKAILASLMVFWSNRSLFR